MQEHEYMYEHEHEQLQDSLSTSELAEDLSGQAFEQVEEQNNGEIASQDSSEIAELLAELRDRRVTLRLGRGLVVGLILSFLGCMAAFWLSGILLSVPGQLLPMAFLQMLAANRILVLCVPIICLIVCYIALRSLTSEIMVVPERYLDERQKMLRDQAHHSAFKIIKFSSVLIPIAFVLPHLPWFNAPTPVVAQSPLTRFVNVISTHPQSGSITGTVVSRHGTYQVIHFFFPRVSSIPFVYPKPPIQPASSLEIALASGLLLLVLLLVVSALPMIVLAWKGKA